MMMNSRIVHSKSRQAGFTLVEIVAVTVIVTILAAYAIPRMMGPGEFAVRTAADRLVAALHYAQTLAQRQGISTSVEIGFSSAYTVTVKQSGSAVKLQNEDYLVVLQSDVSISYSPVGCSTLIFNASDGVPSPTTCTYLVNEDGVKRYKVTVQPTGFVQLGS